MDQWNIDLLEEITLASIHFELLLAIFLYFGRKHPSSQWEIIFNFQAMKGCNVSTNMTQIQMIHYNEYHLPAIPSNFTCLKVGISTSSLKGLIIVTLCPFLAKAWSKALPRIWWLLLGVQNTPSIFEPSTP